MANSYTSVTGTGAPQTVTVPAYIDQAHIKVNINNAAFTGFTWVNASTVTLTAPLGSFVKVFRSTSPNVRLVDFIDGVPLDEVTLDTDSKQAFYLAQEQLDATQDALLVIGQPNFQAIAEDITAKSTASAASATAAATSASAAATSATTAGESSGTASGFATTAGTQAGNASASATDAATSAASGTTSATAAATSATAAANSAAASAGSATASSGYNDAAYAAAVAAQASATSAATSAASVIGLPVGSVVMFPANVAPSGLLKANGTVLSRAAYAALWAFASGSGNIASEGSQAKGQFSFGDGSTTFRIPDLRGEFLRVWDDGRGVDTGRAIGTAQAGQNASHTHTASTATSGAHSHASTASGGSADGQAFGSSSGSAYPVPWGNIAGSPTQATSTDPGHTHTVTVTANGGSETRPSNLALLACIKY